MSWDEGKSKTWVEEEDDNGGEESLLIEGTFHERVRRKQNPQNAKAGTRSPYRGATPDSETRDPEPKRFRLGQERGGRKLRSTLSL